MLNMEYLLLKSSGIKGILETAVQLKALAEFKRVNLNKSALFYKEKKIVLKCKFTINKFSEKSFSAVRYSIFALSNAKGRFGMKQ